MHCQAQRLLVKYAKNLRKTEVFSMIYSCSSSKSVQRYFTCCIILWKNNVFSRRRVRMLACIDFGVLWAPFGRLWDSKLGPCWGKLGFNWVSNCDFWRLLGDLGALNWFWTWIGVDSRAKATKNKICKKPKKNWGFLYDLFLFKFKISSTFALLASKIATLGPKLGF